MLSGVHASLKISVFNNPKSPRIADTIMQMIVLENQALRRFKTTKNPACVEYYIINNW